MARRKTVEAPQVAADSPDAPPPSELLRFRPSQPAPIGEHGRPEPWRVKWSPEEFAAFLRARAAWRDTHTQPLEGLGGLERMAMHRMALPSGLVQAEEQAARRPPEWTQHRYRTSSTTNERLTNES